MQDRAALDALMGELEHVVGARIRQPEREDRGRNGDGARPAADRNRGGVNLHVGAMPLGGEKGAHCRGLPAQGGDYAPDSRGGLSGADRAPMRRRGAT
jgi:hypothetical protein